MELLTLFWWAFLAATLVPVPSEIGLGYLTVAGEHSAALLWVVATAGNTLGAVVNWLLARSLLHLRERRWFRWLAGDGPSESSLDRFRRWGELSLLLAWVPIVGDPLTFVAGLVGVPLWRFVLWVALGKGARYAVVIWGTDAIL